MVLRTAPAVVYSALKEAIGNPEEYFKNKQRESFPDYDNRIPSGGRDTEDDDIEAAL